MKNPVKYGIILESKFLDVPVGTLFVETPEGSFLFNKDTKYTCKEFFSIPNLFTPNKKRSRKVSRNLRGQFQCKLPSTYKEVGISTVAELKRIKKELRKRLKQLSFLSKADYWPSSGFHPISHWGEFKTQPLTKKEFIAKLKMWRLGAETIAANKTQVWVIEGDTILRREK